MSKRTTNNTADSRILTPPLLVVVRSPRWSSQLQVWLEGLRYAPKVHWLTDYQQARELSRSNHKAALLFEVPEKFSADPEAFLQIRPTSQAVPRKQRSRRIKR